MNYGVISNLVAFFCVQNYV